MKKILSLLLAVLALAGTVSSCTPKTGPGTAGSGTDTTVTTAPESGTDGTGTGEIPPDPPSVTVVNEGETDYAIVFARSLNSSDAVTTALSRLSNAFRANMAVDPKKYSDAVYTGDPDAHLILIGDTALADCSKLSRSLRTGKYYIGMRGEQILIFANTPDAVAQAITYFTNKVVVEQGKQETCTLTLPTDFEFRKKGTYAMDTILCSDTNLYDFRIVIPANATTIESNFANELRYRLAQKYGYTLTVVSDSEKPAENEILVGNTNRGGSSVGVGAYRISAENGTLRFAFDGLLASDAALYGFFDRILPAGKDGSVYTLPEGLSVTGSREEAADDPGVLTKTGDLRVMFYNIAGHSENSNPHGLRQALQIGIFRDYAPDVLCFQEFHRASRTNGFVDQLAELGYREVPVKVDPVTNPGGNNYTPIFYLASRFTVEDSGYLLYSGLNDSHSKGLTWALLRDIATGKRAVVLSTHFWWESKDAADNAARVGDAEQMLAVIAKIYSNPGMENVPLVAGGDLNCVFESDPVKKILEDGTLQAAWDVAKRKNDSGGHHGNATYDASWDLYTKWDRTGAKYRTGWSIDHVFVRGSATVETFHTLLDRYALICSDHCPEIVDISF